MSLRAGILTALGIIISLTTIHGVWIMPAVSENSRKVTRELLREHVSHPHPTGVSRVEFDLLWKRMDEFNDSMKRIADRIEQLKKG